MAPSQAPRGSSGYFTIHGQYLSYAAGINVPGTGVSMYVSANLSDSQIETSYSVAPDAGVGAHTVIDTTTSGTSNGLTFTVPAPPTGCGDPQKDAPIAEPFIRTPAVPVRRNISRRGRPRAAIWPTRPAARTSHSASSTAGTTVGRSSVTTS